MKKRWIGIIMMLAAMVLLSGCGEMTLEEKVAKVQEANIITVQDVIDLMELEGLQVEKLTPDNTFQKQWPNGELVKINDTHYMALQSFEEDLNQREKVLRDTGWYHSYFALSGEQTEGPMLAASFIGKEYLGYEDGKWVTAKELYGKNVVAILVYNIPADLAAKTQEEVQAILDGMNELSDTLGRVFYNDINGMITEEVSAESENFKFAGTVRYYATGVTDESSKKEWTFYDARTWLDGELVCSDAVWEQYQGSEYKVSVERPDGWENGSSRGSSSGVLEYEDKRLSMPSCDTDDILWKAPEGAPVYEMTITIGDIEETLRLEPVKQNA